MEEKILVMITTGSEEEAARIAEGLLKERLIACANLLGGIRSLYRWQGKVCDDREILMLCKTERRLFSRLSEKVKSIHSYEVPEIITLEIKYIDKKYSEWLNSNIKPKK